MAKKPLNNLLRGAIASLRGARNLAYLSDMSRFLRSVRLALTPLATVLQRFPNRRNSGIAAGTAWSLLLFAALIIGAGTTVHGASVAMVTDLQGKAAMPGEGKSREVAILSELAAGAQVQLDAGASMVVLYLASGDEYAFTGPAQIAFRAERPEVTKGAQPQKRVPTLSKGGRDIRIRPLGIASGAMVMRSARPGARIQLLSLSGTRTLDVQPEFRWQDVQPGTKYEIEIRDDTGRMLYETQASATTLKLPAAVALIEGTTYTWEVSARLADGRKYSSAGDFSIAPASLRAQADSLRPATNAPLSARVAYAVWLEQMNLKDEARKFWRVLAAERPEDARLKALAAEQNRN
jgi:hypothetical protein